MKSLKPLFFCLMALWCAAGLSSCKEDEPNNNVPTTTPTITADDPEGTVAVNLVKGTYSSDNSIKFNPSKPGFVGGGNLYVTGQDNFAFHNNVDGLKADIRDVGKVNGLSGINTIPTTAGWAANCGVLLKEGYILRYEIYNEETGEHLWEYARIYVPQYYGVGQTLAGFGVKYQPHWKEGPFAL